MEPKGTLPCSQEPASSEELFVTNCSYGEKLSLHPIPKLNIYPLSAVRD